MTKQAELIEVECVLMVKVFPGSDRRAMLADIRSNLKGVFGCSGGGFSYEVKEGKCLKIRKKDATGVQHSVSGGANENTAW